MQAPFTKLLIVALAAILTVGTLDAASAGTGRSTRPVRKPLQASAGSRTAAPGHLVPVDRNGTPIIMQGYRSPRMMRDDSEPVQRADRHVKIPRGSSTYIPPPNPSPYSANSPPAAALTQPTVQPYKPPPITTFSDRVNERHSGLSAAEGIGNNPTDQQQFIRQRVNQ